MIPAIQCRTGTLMESGALNFVAGNRRDTPVQIIDQRDLRPEHVVLGYVICDHTTCCREHGTQVTPHTRCILR